MRQISRTTITGGILLLAICSLTGPSAHAQSVSGVPGYVTIPVATFNSDGVLQFGTSFLPKQHLAYTENQRDAVAVYASLTFLRFVEVDLRVTRQLNVPAGANHVADRVPTVRFSILREKRCIPALAIGFHDVLTSLESGEAHHFGATYLVATKNFRIPKIHLNLGTTAGWGAGRFLWENNEFVGPFGGVALSVDKIPWFTLLADYNGSTVNAALRFDLFRHILITAGTLGFNSFTGGISYRFNLIR